LVTAQAEEPEDGTEADCRADRRDGQSAIVAIEGRAGRHDEEIGSARGMASRLG
jgi:hypothetical protein